MTFDARIWIEDGQILCCSQMCSEECNDYGKCKPVQVEVKEDFENV